MKSAIDKLESEVAQAKAAPLLKKASAIELCVDSLLCVVKSLSEKSELQRKLLIELREQLISHQKRGH